MPRRTATLSTLLSLMLLALASGLAYLGYRHATDRRDDAALAATAQIDRVVQSKIDLLAMTASTVSKAVESSESGSGPASRKTVEAFRAVAPPLLQGSKAESVALAVRVDRKDLRAFEATAQPFSPRGFVVNERGAHGAVKPVASRPVYDIVVASEPSATAGRVLGYDLSSNPRFKEAIERAIAKRSTTSYAGASPIPVDGEIPNALTVFAPIVAAGTDTDPPGVALSIVRMSTLFTPGSSMPALGRLDAALYGGSADSGLYSTTNGGPAASNTWKTPLQIPGGSIDLLTWPKADAFPLNIRWPIGGGVLGVVVGLLPIVALRRATRKPRRTNKLSDRIAERNRVLESLYAATAILGQGNDPDAVIHQIAEVAKEGAYADFSAILLRNPTTGSMDRCYSAGIDSSSVAPIAAVQAIGVLAPIDASTAIVRSQDAVSSPSDAPDWLAGLHDWFGVPIQCAGVSWGEIYVARRGGQAAFTEAEERALEELAGRTGDLLQRAGLIRELQEAAARFSVLRKAPVLLLTFSPDGSCFYASPDLEDKLGVPATDVYLTPDALWRTAHPSDRDHIRAHFASTLASGGDLDQVVRVEHPVRGELWTRVRAQAIRDPSGHVESVAVVVVDETEIRSAQAELESVNQELTDFTYIVSHDLQAPLRNVTAYTELIERELGPTNEDDSRTATYLGILRDQAAKMSQMVEDLLQISRVGRSEERFQPVALDAILDEVLADRTHDIETTHATIVRLTHMPTVSCVAVQIRQVLGNLIENALKYSGREPRVEISAAEGSDHWFITVSDNGIGIDPAHHAEIFKIFRRVAGADAPKGTGAGLAICKKIAELHAGAISVDSAPGQGSSFTFSIAKNLGSGQSDPTTSHYKLSLIEPEASAHGRYLDG